jgi:hypothetical protein
MLKKAWIYAIASITFFTLEAKGEDKVPYCKYKEFYESGVFETPDPSRTLEVSKLYWRDIFTPIDGCGLNGETIYELIKRYSLQGKSIIAFGPGEAREERFFFFNGMSPVVLADFTTSYLPIEKMKDKNKWKGNDKDSIVPDSDHVYFVECMQEHAAVNPLLEGKFDVTFVSGSSIQEFRSICLKQTDQNIAVEWPVNQKVFVENVLLTAKCLKEGGLLIIQNWASGNVPVTSKNFLTTAKEQLEKNGIQLLEVYARSKGDKGTNVAANNDEGFESIHLFIAYKGTKPEALKYYKEVADKEDINSIFGSYYYSYPAYKTTKKVYSII